MRLIAATVAVLLAAVPNARAEPVTLEGRFGRVLIDTARPSLTSLVLRARDGTLDPQSVIAAPGGTWMRGVAGWGEGGYTYVVDTAGKRFESRANAPGGVVRSDGGLVLNDVKLAAPGEPPVAVERWTLSCSAGPLSWTVERRWLRPFTARAAGTPGLFASFRRTSDSEMLPNATTHTLWVEPGQLVSSFEPLYREWPSSYKISLSNCVAVRSPDTWAIAKLWTGWPSRADLRLAVRGGHLYRRGFMGWRAELGAISSPASPRRHRAGQVERVTLKLDAVPANATGYQLAVNIPDRTVGETLRAFYGSLLNGGVVNDQRRYDFGNETDGWYYDGSAWMHGLALASGTPAAGRLASAPFDAASAFRGHLAAILGTVDATGRGSFGYDWTGSFPDARLHTVTGAREYLLHTGDLAFIRQALPDLERGVGWYLARRNARGLVDLGAVAHWYYDAMPGSGVSAYHNALVFQACRHMAEMLRAVGKPASARRYDTAADRVKAAFGVALWQPDAPGGPRLTDWIDRRGTRVSYAADVCQFPAVAFGLLPPDRARALLKTIDRRTDELGRQYGYAGVASLSAYWPVPDAVNPHAWQRTYPVYMNGGSFLAITYFEIMARIEAGDVDGAWDRLRRFSAAVGLHRGAGNNWVNVHGDVAPGADEPYLGDMVVVPAALVRGFLGIRPTWERLEVRPRLPLGWTRASAEVLYKGVRHRVDVDGRRVTVTRLDRAYTPPPVLTWEVLSAPPPEWQMSVSRHFANGATAPVVAPAVTTDGGRRVALADRYPARGMRLHRSLTSAEGLRVAGPVRFGVPGPAAGVPAADFGGEGHADIPGSDHVRFGATESFTVQCWFRTGATDSHVMVARPEAYCLYVKRGRLAAWVMQAGLQYREALGSAVSADGAWHHAAAVYDRATQRLALYLDGRLDTPDGRPGPRNPVDILPIGASASMAPLCIGGLGSGFPFTGAIADVRVHAGALRRNELSYPHPVAEAEAQRSLAPSGTYVTSVADWGQRAAMSAAVIEGALNGGTIRATLECSDDGFRSVGRRVPLRVRTGRATTRLRGGRWRWARVRFALMAPGGRTRTPEVRYVLLRAVPEPVNGSGPPRAIMR